jgi:hypothetical protein
MSGDFALTVPAQRRPIGAVDPASSVRFVGRAPTDPAAVLAARMRLDCVAAVDVDEVAAILEANGINDRVAAREYGAPTVFALANRVVASTRYEAPRIVTVEGPRTRRVIVDTLVRAAIYLMPLGIGLGAASEVDGVPSVAVTGTLLVGWGGGQALSFLGYRALANRGASAAAGLLGAGFLVLTVAWCTVLFCVGVPWPRGFLVAGAQLALFAVAAAALVTNRERAVLLWALPCWLSTVYIWLGGGPPAVVALLLCLLLLTVAAFRPVLADFPTGPTMLSRRRWRSWRSDLSNAFLYGAVGTGQAALLTIVALDGIATTRVPPEAIPLLVGVPLIELTLVWHQRRIAAARAALDDRAAFDRRLAQVSAGTVAVLAFPVLAGAALAVAAWAGAHPPGGQALAASVLLTAIYALCLVLAAHRRAGTAATLVWWPALLVAGLSSGASALVQVAPRFTETLAAVTLLGASLPGLVLAALVLRDPESYR